jgi:hypothetical protein
MAGWVLGAIALLLLWALVARIRTYGRLLSDAHFLAIGRGAPALKSAALERIATPQEERVVDASDPRILKTAAGLAIVYTVSRQDAEFVHHCSASVPGNRVAHGALQFLLSFALLLLGLPLAKARFAIGAGNIHHAELKLSAEEQAGIAAQPQLDTSDTNLFALRARAAEARRAGN